MNVTLLPCGDRALLAQVADVDDVLALTAALRNDPECSAAIAELVPAAVTVLLEAHDVTDLQALAAAVTAVAERTDAGNPAAKDGEEVLIPVRYDGPDLADVAAATGLTTDEVIARHSGSVWRAAFGGFSPGFAYLVGGPPEWDVPRRTESRTAVPAGSVGLAGGYSAVYPSESPGGWQLIGTTDIGLWDVDRDPPAVIRPGTLVRFVEADKSTAAGSTAAGSTAAGSTAAGS